jgi:hypothetical protein
MDKSSLICLFRLLSLAEPLAHNLPKLAFEHIKAIASSLAFSSEKFFPALRSPTASAVTLSGLEGWIIS